MDPVWAAVAELWWIGPSVIGAGALGWAGLRGQRRARARRLGYTAARDSLRTARQDGRDARVAARLARAELARLQADRAAGRATAGEVAAARRELDAAQREAKAAAATVRARRAGVSAERVALGRHVTGPADLPLARLMAADDAVSARFMEYETDPARAIAFPAMSDVRVPATAAFVAELRATRALRPATPDARITPTAFAAYRDGVARLSRAFQAAEAEAWRLARAEGSAPPGPGPDSTPASVWVASAQEMAQNLTQNVLARGAEALARATAGWPNATPAGENPAPRRPTGSPTGSGTPETSRAPEAPEAPDASATPATSATRPPSAAPDRGTSKEETSPGEDPRASSDAGPPPRRTPRIWPVPSRGSRRDGS